jgi:hypothetical protein
MEVAAPGNSCAAIASVAHAMCDHFMTVREQYEACAHSV